MDQSRSAYILMDYGAPGAGYSRESLGGSSVSGGTSWRQDPYLDHVYHDTNGGGYCSRVNGSNIEENISSSLPNTHVLDTTTPTLHVSHSTVSTSAAVSDITEVTAPAPTAGIVSATSCVSLHRSQSHSPVSRFSKYLRNSFSKLRSKRTSLHVKSRSVDILKKGFDNEDDESEVTSDVISPINEEIVIQSQQKGLPIIPFPCPNFVIIDKNLEETKSLIRENSYKEMTISPKPPTLKKFEQHPRGTEIESYKNSFIPSSSEIIQSSKLTSQNENNMTERPGSVLQEPNTPSSYVEMCPPRVPVLHVSHVSGNSNSGDSYMAMDTRSMVHRRRHTLNRLKYPLENNVQRRFSDDNGEEIFHLDEPSTTKPVKISQNLKNGKTDSISPLSQKDQKKYRKGNKHKGDYCFVDLGLGDGAGEKKRSSSFSNNRSWKTLTFNKK